jgi:glycosyltransferase involved in cell wall biosynthesis
VGDYDVLIVGYPGQLDVFIARLLSWLRRKPLVWDIFMSIYLIALERNLDQENKLAVGMLRALERNACSLPNLLIIDTSEYAKWFQITHGISKDRLRLVPTGADDRVFHPSNDYAKKDQFLRIVYYGTFIPNHGVPYIMEAARLLANSQDIKFDLIGQGPDREFATAYKVKHELNNVQFIDWLDKESLVKHLAKADISLGAFGTTPQSLMTVQNKIYEGMAMGKAVVTGDSPAVRQVFEHCTHLYLCERANPEALAQAILALYKNPELLSKLGIEGHNLYGKQYALEKLGALFSDHLASLVSSNP